MIYLAPVCGLCNRMRALDSGLALAHESGIELKVLWSFDEYVCAPFEELFQPIEPVEVIPIKQYVFYSLVEQLKQVSEEETDEEEEEKGSTIYLAPREIDKMNKPEEQIMNMLNEKDDMLIHSFSRFYPNLRPYHFLQPIPTVCEKIEEIIHPFTPDTIGVHIRRTDNVMSIENSPVALFKEKMQQEIELNPAVNFYVASDDIEVKKELLVDFAGKILTDLRPVHRNSVEEMQRALAEVYALSRTSRILGSYWSSYSETAAELSGIPLEVVKSNPNQLF